MEKLKDIYFRLRRYLYLKFVSTTIIRKKLIHLEAIKKSRYPDEVKKALVFVNPTISDIDFKVWSGTRKEHGDWCSNLPIFYDLTKQDMYWFKQFYPARSLIVKNKILNIYLKDEILLENMKAIDFKNWLLL